MGFKVGIKWEKTYLSKPVHNIVSSDFPKYQPIPWKFMEGRPPMSLILAHEYQRMWIEERNAWQKRMYPETGDKIDLVKRYVATFKANNQPPKPEPKKPFKMKKFQKVPNKTSSKRQPDDKHMRKPMEPEKKQS